MLNIDEGVLPDDFNLSIPFYMLKNLLILMATVPYYGSKGSYTGQSRKAIGLRVPDRIRFSEERGEQDRHGGECGRHEEAR